MGTLRQQISAMLQEQPMTVRQLADMLGIPMTAVVEHLTHVQRSLGKRLIVSPASCLACGFSMTRQRRFTAPSRCPRCKSEKTTQPRLEVG
jgi:transcriptional regulator